MSKQCNEPWRFAWRYGFAQVLSTEGLEALSRALQCNSPLLLQGSTILPPALAFNAHEPCDQLCPIALAACDGHPPQYCNVEDVEEAFAMTCIRAGELLGHQSEVRHFMNWWDDGKREEVIAQLLAEVLVALAERNLRMPAA